MALIAGDRHKESGRLGCRNPAAGGEQSGRSSLNLVRPVHPSLIPNDPVQLMSRPGPGWPKQKKERRERERGGERKKRRRATAQILGEVLRNGSEERAEPPLGELLLSQLYYKDRKVKLQEQKKKDISALLCQTHLVALDPSRCRIILREDKPFLFQSGSHLLSLFVI